MRRLQIGPIQLDSPTVLPPMAGVTNRPYRRLCREQGAGLVFTEMASDLALVHGNQPTRRLIEVGPDEHPIGVQIFGSNPATMAEAARIARAAGADLVDVNMGCPVDKIARRSRCGSALLREPRLAAEIIAAMVRAVDCPVTAKIRIGWDEAHINAVEMVRALEAAGASAVTIHGRTREQFYRGRARWDVIRDAVEAVQIPIIGNGDITAPEDARAIFEQTGCAGIAIARGSTGNPWIFRRVNHYLETGEILPEPSPEERIRTALRHLVLMVEAKGEYIGVREMRKHAAWYTKGLPDAAAVRDRLNRCETQAAMADVLTEYLTALTSVERSVV